MMISLSKEAVFCEHANENPNVCPCSSDCYCKQNTCKNKLDLINRERTLRPVICLNPDHETVTFETNETGTIKCPICESPMVVIVKSVVRLNELG